MTDPDSGKTIGDFRFGLDSDETQARFMESLYRDLEPLQEWGEVPAGTTFSDVADAILDTIAGYTSEASIPATDLPALLEDALTQLRGPEYN